MIEPLKMTKIHAVLYIHSIYTFCRLKDISHNYFKLLCRDAQEFFYAKLRKHLHMCKNCTNFALEL